MKGVLQSQTPGARHRTGESWEQTGHHSPCQMVGLPAVRPSQHCGLSGLMSETH